MLTPREKSPLLETQRRVEQAVLHHTGLRHTFQIIITIDVLLSHQNDSSDVLWIY